MYNKLHPGLVLHVPRQLFRAKCDKPKREEPKTKTALALDLWLILLAMPRLSYLKQEQQQHIY